MATQQERIEGTSRDVREFYGWHELLTFSTHFPTLRHLLREVASDMQKHGVYFNSADYGILQEAVVGLLEEIWSDDLDTIPEDVLMFKESVTRLCGKPGWAMGDTYFLP